MQKTNNIYKYKTEKSKNEETHYLYTKGRITIRSFILRLFLSISIYVIFLLINIYYVFPKKEIALDRKYDLTLNNSILYFELFFNFILPIILILYIVIQGVKRIHDTNKTGWFILIPLYNLILLFSKGTIGSNEYGIDPKPNKKVKYFDEIED